MAYSAWSVVFGEQPSAAKWNILGTNDSYFNGHLPAGYSLQFFGKITGPSTGVDGATYYIGTDYEQAFVETTAAIRRIYTPKTGTVKAIYGSVYNTGVVSTSETSTISFRLNDTTDTTITSALALNAAATTLFNNTSLSVAVTAGNYFEIKWVAPTWATNPGGDLYFNGQVYIEI